MKKIKIAILLILFQLINFSPAFAQEVSFGFSPSKFELNLSATQSASIELQIFSEIDDYIPVELEIINFLIGRPATEGWMDETGVDMQNWIKLEQKEFILSPNQSRTLNIDVQVPEIVQPASYFATILIKPVLPPEYFEPQSAKAVGYLGVPVAITVDGDKIDAERLIEIERLTTSPIFIAREVDIETTTINKGNTFDRLEGVLKITNILGQEVQTFNVDQFSLLPREEKDLIFEWSSGSLIGPHTAKLELTSGEEIVLENSYSFIIIPPLWLGISIVSTIVFIYVLTNRKKVFVAIQVLFRGRKVDNG